MTTDVETNSSGDLLAIATKGDVLSASLLDFAAQFRFLPHAPQDDLSSLATIVSFTSTHLKNLNKTLAEYGNDIKIDDALLPSILQIVDAHFGKLDGALKKVIQAGKHGRGEVLTGVNMEESRLLFPAFGLERGRVFSTSLHDVENNIWNIANGTKYLGLRSLVKANRLDLEQKMELERLNSFLGTLVEDLVKTKLWINGHKEILEMVGGLLIENEQTIPAEGAQINFGGDNGPRGRILDDDARSIASYDSCASNQFLGIKETFEAWKLCRSDNGDVMLSRRSWSFLGLTVKEHFDNFGWYVEPLLKTDEEIQAMNETVLAGALKPEQKGANESLVASLPGFARQEIRFLLQDRERVSSNPRYIGKWQLISIKAAKPSRSQSISWPASWWSGRPECSEWELVIKGEIIDRKEAKLPDRHRDPFRKNNPGRVIIERRPRERIYPRSISPRPRRDTYEDDRPRYVGRQERVEEVRQLVPEEAEKKIGDLLVEMHPVDVSGDL